jgi:hypothetical protein
LFLWTAVLVTVYFLLNKFVFSKIQGMRRVTNFVSRLFVFGFFIRYLLHVYICFTLSAFMNVEKMDWSSGAEGFSSFLALVFTFVNAVMPFALAYAFTYLKSADLYAFSKDGRINTVLKGLDLKSSF